jgi:hypothetical protein
MLGQRQHPRHKRQEYCLVSRDGSRVLEWFGTRKPSGKRVQKAEARVEYYKHKGK